MCCDDARRGSRHPLDRTIFAQDLRSPTAAASATPEF
jgi:hypothetical protein